MSPASAESPSSPPSRSRSWLRTYFLTGLIVAGPVAITLYIAWALVTWVDGWVKPFIPRPYLPETYLPFVVPGFGLIIMILVLILIGFLTANLVGRTIVDMSERMLARTPFVSGLYKGVKQIFETVFSQSGSSFRKVGLVQFPAPGMWSIVFLSAPATGEVSEKLPAAGEYLSVFLPCTPNPTTGFYFYVARRDVIELGMSVEDGAKLVMSAGLIQPAEAQAELAALAATAHAAAARALNAAREKEGAQSNVRKSGNRFSR
ncbi:MAG: hypothetical protein BGP06_06100 [Rhizobiales bacterium 65-9]|nr:DUF502 domain-containing protein [Hyphomicrobiales bacterium]OJY35430.1 MAG: hypothetical protein BGP06_06100 [Rhizobiales bacterium 65-9]